MGVRLRKLARELQLSPTQVLALMQELGYVRYRSADDMVSDAVVARIRVAAKGTRPTAPPPQPTPNTAAQAKRRDPSDLMSGLVPGVVPQRAQEKFSKPPDPPAAAPRDPKLQAALAEATARVGELETELETERSKRERLEVALAQATAVTPDPEPVEPDPVLPPDGTVTLQVLLEERGLRGADEAERAVAALAGAHLLGPHLLALTPTDPERLRRLLAQRLVLVGGPVPERFDLPAVTVSEERADLPSAERLARLAGRVGEQLMLCGLRRVALAGVSPRWQALLRAGIDARIELNFRPGSPGARLLQQAETEGLDALVVWNPVSGPTPAGQIRVYDVEASDLGTFLDRLGTALAAE